MKTILKFFSKKSLICVKWTILGAKKTHGHNSGLVLRISFYFYVMRERERERERERDQETHESYVNGFSKELCWG